MLWRVVVVLVCPGELSSRVRGLATQIKAGLERQWGAWEVSVLERMADEAGKVCVSLRACRVQAVDKHIGSFREREAIGRERKREGRRPEKRIDDGRRMTLMQTPTFKSSLEFNCFLEVRCYP